MTTSLRHVVVWTSCSIAVVLLGGGVSVATPRHTIEPPSNIARGLSELSQLPYFDDAVTSRMASSHAPVGDNFDYGPFLYEDSSAGKVLLDVAGPGVITRWWMTGNSIDDFGHIRIYFDGETRPRVDLLASEFFSGTRSPFLAPLCGPREVSSGGYYCDLRMPFNKGVRVVASAGVDYYNIGYETYAAGTDVETFNPSSPQTHRAIADQIRTARRGGADPGVLPHGATHTGKRAIAAGRSVDIARVSGPGALRAIEISLSAHADETMQNVWLNARWDGDRLPAVSAPLADLFLTGAGERTPALGLLAGYRPATHTGYLYFPMPFARGAVLTLVNRSAQAVTAVWRVEQSSATYADVGSLAGQLHATFAQTPATENGADYVALDASGRGKVVGVSLTEEGPWSADQAFFMEGDERVYLDGSNSPSIYGTGTEDLFGGGFYYEKGPFTLFDHGATAKETPKPGTGRTSQYRLMLQDPWSFRSGIRFGIEHGAGDGLPTANRSVVFWYGSERSVMKLTDKIEVGSPSSVATAHYSASKSTPVTVKAFYEGDRDGNMSSPLFDQIQPGAQRPPPGTDLDLVGEQVTASGATHPVGTVIRFDVRILPKNKGVVLRRLLDQATFGQRAAVRVNGAAAGIWLTPGSNASKRWAESDFTLPQSLTRGRDRISIELRVEPSPFAPSGAAVGWTDFLYHSYAML